MEFLSYTLQQPINGLQLGAVYALIALGYTMVYGVLRLINFAHGDIFMFGAFVAYFFIARWHVPLYLVFVITMAATAFSVSWSRRSPTSPFVRRRAYRSSSPRWGYPFFSNIS